MFQPAAAGDGERPVSAGAPGERRVILLKARALVAEAAALVRTKARHTHGAYSRAHDGEVVSPRDRRAFAFCAAGAPMRAEWDLHNHWLERDPSSPFEGPDGRFVGPAWLLIALDQLAVGLLTQAAALGALRRADGTDGGLWRRGRLADEVNWLNDQLDHADIRRGFEIAIRNTDTPIGSLRRRSRRKPGTLGFPRFGGHVTVRRPLFVVR